jgi:DNA-binding IscR family transcriptional regulator
MFKGRKLPWTAGDVCAIHAVMLEAEEKMRAVLKNHSLADVSRRVAGKALCSQELAFEQWLSEK